MMIIFPICVFLVDRITSIVLFPQMTLAHWIAFVTEPPPTE